MSDETARARPKARGIDFEGWRGVEVRPLDPEAYARLARWFRPISRYFRARLLRADRFPREGGALIVGNHATWGVDSFALLPLLFDETGRIPYGLGEKHLFATPLGRRLVAAVGGVPGAPENAHALLTGGEVCVCYPGAERDSFKRWWQRHTIHWGSRMGYLRSALRAGVPLVPVVGVGIDDAFPVLGQDRVVARRLLGSKRYDLPLFLSMTGLAGLTGPLFAVPFPVPFVFEVGEPWRFDEWSEERREACLADPAALAALHAEVAAAFQAQLDDLVRRNATPVRDTLARAARRWIDGGTSRRPAPQPIRRSP